MITGPHYIFRLRPRAAAVAHTHTLTRVFLAQQSRRCCDAVIYV